jgi:hypothetical protein
MIDEDDVQSELDKLRKMRDMIDDSVISLTSEQRLKLNTRIEALEWVLE